MTPASSAWLRAHASSAPSYAATLSLALLMFYCESREHWEVYSSAPGRFFLPEETLWAKVREREEHPEVVQIMDASTPLWWDASPMRWVWLWRDALATLGQPIPQLAQWFFYGRDMYYRLSPQARAQCPPEGLFDILSYITAAWRGPYSSDYLEVYDRTTLFRVDPAELLAKPYTHSERHLWVRAEEDAWGNPCLHLMYSRNETLRVARLFRGTTYVAPDLFIYIPPVLDGTLAEGVTLTANYSRFHATNIAAEVQPQRSTGWVHWAVPLLPREPAEPGENSPYPTLWEQEGQVERLVAASVTAPSGVTLMVRPCAQPPPGAKLEIVKL